MRTIKIKAMNKRGCKYCADYVPIEKGANKNNYCKHDSCPYHELDKYETYKQYLKENPGVDITQLLRK